MLTAAAIGGSALARSRRPAGRGFWRCYWVTLRPYLFFVSGASALVGLALVPAMPLEKRAAAFVSLFFSYGLGQALTDVFQRDTDSLSSPYRPLVRGEITAAAVFAASLSGLVGCAAILFALNPRTLLYSGAAVAGLLAYTPCKRRFWAGPLCNSWIMALLPVIAALCGARSAGRVFSDPRLLPAIGSVFGSYAAFVILGYFKDVEADRQTGYRTLPVVFGRRISVAFSAAVASAGALCSVVFLRRALPSDASAGPELVLALCFWAAGLSGLGLAHVRIVKTKTDGEAYPSIALVVRAFVALHLGEAAIADPSLAPWILPLYGLFEVALAGRPCRTQI